jgi:hypothetical protein
MQHLTYTITIQRPTYLPLLQLQHLLRARLPLRRLRRLRHPRLRSTSRTCREWTT